MSADNTPITQQPCEPPTLSSSSDRTQPAASGISSRDQLPPKLGNFSRILASSGADWASPSFETENRCTISDQDEARADLKLDSYTRLGDFQRVLNQFQSMVSFEAKSIETSPVILHHSVSKGCVSIGSSDHSCHISDAEASDLSSLQRSRSNKPCKPCHLGKDTRLGSSYKQPPITILKRPVPSRPIVEDFVSSDDVDSKSDSDRCLELDPPVITPASTPPSPQPKKFVSVKRVSPGKVSKTKARSKSLNGVLLSYYLGKDSPAIHIYGQLRTKEQKHEALMMELRPNRILDAAMAKKYPKVASHGTHVFVDMSNIDIGFQKALRARYKLGDNAHFSPLPHLNLEFLNEVLLRGRTAITRSVGCSIVPGRSEPRYVQELQSLGYHVDLRERKPIQNAKNASLNVRYVEDLVDETLQTRIAESVMEYFQKQGTIILATGDAKPAQYSDGFFAYAERALRMGWHIELVSWNGSLSSAWTSRKWKSQWGNRFRIIELDDFLDNILAFDP